MTDQPQDKDKYLKRRSGKRSRKRRRSSKRPKQQEAKGPQNTQRPQSMRRPAQQPQVREKPEPEPGPKEILTAFPILLGLEQVTEDTFEEELFAADWEPAEGHVRTADIMLSLMRNIIIADAGDYTLYGGEEVVLSTDRGIETGRVIMPPAWRKTGSGVKVKILRVVGHSDIRQMSRNQAKELGAFETGRNLISKLKLDMKLLRAKYLHGGGRVLFYFTARKRVDFRQLVKELHSTLHVRVELRQIGVRDAVKMEGGIGPCGLHVCCNRFLSSFKPVSVRMVKEQNMMMNPQKVSGICGRLLCCLEYEHAEYRKHFYKLPAMGQRVRTPDGDGVVVDLNVLGEQVKVQDGDNNAKWWYVGKLEKFAAQVPEKDTGDEDPDMDMTGN